MDTQTRFFEHFKFDNRSLNDLPIDPVEENRVRQVAGAVRVRRVFDGFLLRSY